MALNAAIPVIPAFGSPYNPIELFAIEIKNNGIVDEWTLEDLGKLARLEADLRSDIGYLEGLAADVHQMVMDAVDRDRTRDMQAAS